MDYPIVARQSLSENDLQQIRTLEEVCNRFEGIKLKLNWGMLEERSSAETNDFLCFNPRGELIGFLGMYGFSREEVEISGMVHPDFRRQGVFRRLLGEARGELRRRGSSRILFICERKSASGKAWVESRGTEFEHSEYKMELQSGMLPVQDEPRVSLRIASAEDIPFFASVDAMSFGVEMEEAEKFYESISGQSNEMMLVGELDRKPVGIIRIFKEGRNRLICGFAVLPEYRGKGFGREILGLTVKKALEQNPEKVVLEVACENETALNLYKSCGFQVTSAYDYYKLSI